MPKPIKHRLAILTYDRLCTFEYGCAVEVFALPRPEVGDHWYETVIVQTEDRPARGIGNVVIEADGGLDLLDTVETIVIPGWPGPDHPATAELEEALKKAHARGVRLVAICAGAFVLARAGLLEGRRATTHWFHTDKLAALDPGIRVQPDVLYVDEEKILTSAGSAAGLDLCLHIVRKDFGAAIANMVARRLVVPPHREGGQAQFIDRPIPPRSGTRFTRLHDTVRTQLAEPWPIARMAEEAGMSVRGFHRHMRQTTGMAPGIWLIQERVNRGRDLLEETNLSIDGIAQEIGFSNASIFRKHFRSRFGISPSRYRAQF